MHPISNKPTRFFSTAKTQTFNKAEDINIHDLKLRPITKLGLIYIMLPK